MPMIEQDEVKLGWTDASVPLHTHACFYYSDEETLRRSLAFLRFGLDSPDEFGVIFADASRHASLLGWLQEGYPGTLADLIAGGRLALVGGAPTREQLLTNLTSTLDTAVGRGVKLIRFLGFIAWGHAGWPDEESLLAFESQVNEAVMAYPAVIICTYGVPSLSGGQLVNGGLETHKVVFLNDRTLINNPLYEEPATRAGRSAST